ncbi:MAG TPA: AAA family ATPase [Sedimentisphaerales bacterium]|nr:AAA family ATPase [Sedimentisphaerales bacterium]
MITKVTLQYFKKFDREEFQLEDRVVLAGPNNSGKSTLLQAIAVWNLALQRWRQERGGAKSKRRRRSGFPVSRKDFTAIPLREMNLLWTDRSTAYSKDEEPAAKPGQLKPVTIAVQGAEPAGTPWQVNVAIGYSSREQIYVKLLDKDGEPLTELPPDAAKTQVVHIPPFSGIGAEETKYDHGYQNLLIGQGKPGDILRNLLLEIFKEAPNSWNQLKQDIKELFDYTIIDPSYSDTDPFIVIEYRPFDSRKAFDLASAGSGFHQVLTLFGFIYAREASVLLVDEPDAHEHIILQRQVYERLRTVARRRNCQLIVSTHSEVILEETTAQQILSFYGRPHRVCVAEERDQVREALRRLSSLDILATESGHNILYVESDSDINILSAFAKILNHPSTRFFNDPSHYLLRGSDPRQAKAHFFALQAVWPNIRGILLLDRDNKDIEDHDVKAEGLQIVRWERYEIENYLLVPPALLRYIRTVTGQPELFQSATLQRAEEFLRTQFPPAAFDNPLGDNPFLKSIPASKQVLPNLFASTDLNVPKKDYYQIAEVFKADEVHPHITKNLDLIADILLPPTDSANL